MKKLHKMVKKAGYEAVLTTDTEGKNYITTDAWDIYPEYKGLYQIDTGDLVISGLREDQIMETLKSEGL